MKQPAQQGRHMSRLPSLPKSGMLLRIRRVIPQARPQDRPVPAAGVRTLLPQGADVYAALVQVARQIQPATGCLRAGGDRSIL